MRSGQVVIINKLGLHARAASKFVNVAGAFGSAIHIGTAEKLVNGKSIMNVMMLAAGRGTELLLCADGDDENEAFDALCELIDDKFGEGE